MRHLYVRLLTEHKLTSAIWQRLFFKPEAETKVVHKPAVWQRADPSTKSRAVALLKALLFRVLSSALGARLGLGVRRVSNSPRLESALA